MVTSCHLFRFSYNNNDKYVFFFRTNVSANNKCKYIIFPLVRSVNSATYHVGQTNKESLATKQSNKLWKKLVILMALLIPIMRLMPCRIVKQWRNYTCRCRYHQMIIPSLLQYICCFSFFPGGTLFTTFDNIHRSSISITCYYWKMFYDIMWEALENICNNIHDFSFFLLIASNKFILKPIFLQKTWIIKCFIIEKYILTLEIFRARNFFPRSLKATLPFKTLFKPFTMLF